MISEILNNITNKSKRLVFESSRNYKGHGIATVPYEEVIVFNNDYTDKIFLVHKNMIMDRNSISDSSYNVYSFDKKGDFLGEEDVAKLGQKFFINMQVVEVI